MLDFIRELAAAPHGLLLVTGPTGSGKTTTLYAALTEINTGLDKIITIEDPVEYQLPGVLQIPVNEKKGLTFARGLRSILRHDPDKIMVGEIRDCRDRADRRAGGAHRSPGLHNGARQQRVRRHRTLRHDGRRYLQLRVGAVGHRRAAAGATELPALHHAAISRRRRCSRTAESRRCVRAEAANFQHGVGCAHCRGTGFKGRKAIAEKLPLTDTLRDLLSERAPLARIKQAARESGYRSLREAAVAAALAGETTLEEINRVTTCD